jgi:hypothetical protein
MLSRLGPAFSLFVLLAGLLAAAAQEPAPAQKAQTPQTSASDAQLPIHTLHVYMDLIQVPVLVLDSEHGRLKPIDPGKFQVSLDSGPKFRPRRVRQQGDDPLSLAILLDPATQPDLMRHLDDAISALAPASLHPEDHVSIYVMDCNLLRTLDEAAADPERLHTAVAEALRSWNEHRKDKPPAPCANRVHLWDSIAWITHRLSTAPGRRVLLAITSGQDKGSHTQWNDLRVYTQSKGVAVFGFLDPSSTHSLYAGPLSSGRSGRGGASVPFISTPASSEDPFDSICELSGGFILTSDPAYTAKHLANFVNLLRERYIVEFIRPRNDSPGEHSIAISVASHPLAFVRSAGVSVMLRDPAQDADPDTIQRDTTDAPQMGTRKPLPAARH